MLHPRPRIPPPIRFPVRSARVFASSVLSAPLTGKQLPSATLRRYLTGMGLARLISTQSLLTLTQVDELVRSRKRTHKQPVVPGTQPRRGPYVASRRRTRRTLASKHSPGATLADRTVIRPSARLAHVWIAFEPGLTISIQFWHSSSRGSAPSCRSKLARARTARRAISSHWERHKDK